MAANQGTAMKRSEREALTEDLRVRLESGHSTASLVNHVVQLIDRAVSRERAPGGAAAAGSARGARDIAARPAVAAIGSQNLRRQPLTMAGASMEDLRDMTRQSVVASQSMGIAADVAARDVDQAIRGQYHSVDQFSGKLLTPLGYGGEEGRLGEGDYSDHVIELKPRPVVEPAGLPDLRQGSGGQVGDLKIYVQTGEHDDGSLGEVFIKADRQGSTISGLLDALSITTSVALQHGVPLETIAEKWARMQFSPSGTTDDKAMPRVSSIVDAVARWLLARYGRREG